MRIQNRVDILEQTLDAKLVEARNTVSLMADEALGGCFGEPQGTAW